jgi:hypothetical protein
MKRRGTKARESFAQLLRRCCNKSFIMTTVTCRFCKDLRTIRNPEDLPSGLPFDELQKESLLCQGGACRMLLRAISKICPEALDTVAYKSITLEYALFFIWPYLPIQLFVTEGKEPFEYYFHKLTDTTGKRHPVWPAITYATSHQDLTSDDSLSFVRHNLMVCIEGHPACQIPVESQAYMPTRVLDVGVVDDGNLDPSLRASIKLVESIGISGDRKYACLSHRWDSSGHTIITERATYENHINGIRYQNLDPAYQDTIHIMRRLRIRYLWIDSLCIIQDSPKDWEAESKTMATVYNKALFTLARHCDSNTSLRCISDDKYLVSDPNSFPAVYARPRRKHIWDTTSTYDSPLLNRGWVYQERLLSPRTVHFSEFEIFWECYQSFSCQCGDDFMYLQEKWDRSNPKLHHAEALCLTDRTKTLDTATIRRRWREMVGEYSGLALTFLSDRLPAIEGCVQQIGEHLKDSYHFGLWEGDLVQDLAWRVEKFNLGPRPSGQFPTPTWSWASAGARVSYVKQVEYLSHARLAITTAQASSCLSKAASLLLLTGQIITGKLKLAEAPGIDHQKKYWDNDNIGIEVDHEYLDMHSNSRSLHGPHYQFYADFELRTIDWNYEVWYRIAIVQLMSSNYEESHLVLWRYGKTIPGSGLEQETNDGYPIYQRIGMLTKRLDRFSQHDLRATRAKLDWSKAAEVTIAIE